MRLGRRPSDGRMFDRRAALEPLSPPLAGATSDAAQGVALCAPGIRGGASTWAPVRAILAFDSSRFVPSARVIGAVSPRDARALRRRGDASATSRHPLCDAERLPFAAVLSTASSRIRVRNFGDLRSPPRGAPLPALGGRAVIL